MSTNDFSNRLKGSRSVWLDDLKNRPYKNARYIALIFVDPESQGKGVGKDIIDEATRIRLERNPDLSGVAVSSSPNSKSFYETIGFEVLEDEKGEDGMQFTSMRILIKQ